MDWPMMLLVTCPVVCATVLGWRYMARLDHEATISHDAAGRAARLQAQHDASEATRAHTLAYDRVAAQLATAERGQRALADSVDKLAATVATAERAREQLEARVNRLGGGR